MIRAAGRELLAHRARVTLAVLSVAIGVAFVVGGWAIGDSVQRARTGGELRTDFDVQVVGNDRHPLGDRELDRVRSVPGVAAAVATVRGQAAVIGAGGTVVGSGFRRGISWTGRDNLQLTGGREPRGPAEVVLNERTAQQAGLRVGARAGVLPGREPRREFTVVGLFAYRSEGVDIPAELAFDPVTARELLGGEYAEIEATVAAGVTPDRLADELTAALPDAYVLTRADLAAEIRAAAAAEAAEVRAFLLAAAALGVLVGSFLIVNTFAVLATARVRQYGLLRAVGATPRQIRRGVLAEAALLGLLGSALGSLLGLGVGYAGLHLLRPPGEVVPFVASPLAVLVGCAVGVSATVAAGYFPARRSAAVPPVVALRADRRVSTRSLRGRRRTGAALLAGGLAAVLATGGADPSQTEVMVGFGGAFALLLAALVLTPVVLPAVLRPLDRLVARRGRPAARLAIRNAARDPRRSAATAAALLLGVALVSAVATVGASTVTDLTAQVRAAVPAGTVVVRAADPGDFLGPDAMAAARAVPGRGAVLGVREGQGTLESADGDREPVWLTAVDPAGVGTAVRPAMVRGRAEVAAGVLLPERDAELLGVDVGDSLTLRAGDDPAAASVRVPVAGVYRDDSAVYGVLVAEPLVAAALPERYRTLYVGAAPGTPAATLRAATERAFAGQPDAVVTDVAGLLDDLVADAALDLALLYGLLGAVLLLAVAGVVNTMVLAVLERTGELGLLRAVGAEQRMVRRTVRWEAVVLCGAGGLLGLAVGLPLGAVFQHLVLDRPLWALTVPWPMVAAILAGLLLAGVLAAAWPARRAAGTAPLAAIAAAG